MLTLDELLGAVLPQRRNRVTTSAPEKVAAGEGVSETQPITHTTQVNALIASVMEALKWRRDAMLSLDTNTPDEVKLAIMKHVEGRYGVGSNRAKRVHAALLAKVANKDVIQALADYVGALILVVTGGLIKRLHYAGAALDYNLPFVVLYERNPGYIAITDPLTFPHPFVRKVLASDVLFIGDGNGAIIEFGKFSDVRDLGLPPLIPRVEPIVTPAPEPCRRAEAAAFSPTRDFEHITLAPLEHETKQFLERLFKTYL